MHIISAIHQFGNDRHTTLTHANFSAQAHVREEPGGGACTWHKICMNSLLKTVIYVHIIKCMIPMIAHKHTYIHNNTPTQKEKTLGQFQMNIKHFH